MIAMINPREEFIEESALILRIVSGSTLLYGFASVYFQTISGSGNTRVTLIVECISTFLYLTSAYFLIKVWKAPIHIVWLVEYVYFIAMAVCSIVYLKWFNWTKEVKLE